MVRARPAKRRAKTCQGPLAAELVWTLALLVASHDHALAGSEGEQAGRPGKEFPGPLLFFYEFGEALQD